MKLITSETIVGTVIWAREYSIQGSTGANKVIPNADSIALKRGCLPPLAL